MSLKRLQLVKMREALCRAFFFNDTATTEIYTLSLHDALPIFRRGVTGVGMASVQLLREEPVGQRCRLRQLQGQRRERPRARQVELARGERGVQRDVPQEIEGELGVVAERIHGDGEAVLVRRCRKTAAHTLTRRGDLLRGARPRPLAQELRHQLREAVLAGGIVGVSARKLKLTDSTGCS